MAYGLKYFCEYKRQDQETTRLEIEEEDYTSYSIEIKMVSCQVVQGNGNAGIQELIKGTRLNIGLATISGLNGEGFNYDIDLTFENVVTEVDYKEFYTQDETKYRVTMYRTTGEIFFRGYILPDLFLDEYVDYQRIINFTASDRLNKLVDVNVEYTNAVLNNRSIANLIISAKNSLLLDDLGLVSGTRFKENTGDVLVPTTNEIGVNQNFLYDADNPTTEDSRNFEEILLNFSKTFFSNIFQWKGDLYFYSVVNSAFNIVDVAEYLNDPLTPTKSTKNITPNDISGRMLSVPTIEGQPTARRAKVVFKVGNQDIDGFDNLVINGDFEQGLFVSTWMSMAGPGIFKWKLRNWTYSDNCDYTNQATRGEFGLPSTNYVVMRERWKLNLNEAQYIESKSRLGETVTPTFLLRFSLKYKGIKTQRSKHFFNDVDAYFVFMLIIRSDTEEYFLKRDDSGLFSWTTTETFIRIKHTQETYGIWNDFAVEDLVPPITGRVHVRLYNTLQLGPTDDYRYNSVYDDVVVTASANDKLDNQDVTFEVNTEQGYSSYADDYNVILGDFQNGFSESALMIDDRPTEFWAFNNTGTLRILDHVLLLYAANVTNPRMTINCRVRMSDLDITRGVMVDGTKYRINHWSLDDAKNIWSLELHKVYDQGGGQGDAPILEFPIIEFDPTPSNSYFSYYSGAFRDFLAGFTVMNTQFPRSNYMWEVSYRGQNLIDDEFIPTENTNLGLFDMTSPSNDTYFQMVSTDSLNSELRNAIAAMSVDWTSGGAGYYSLWTMRIYNKSTDNYGQSYDVALVRAEI